jgi:hypothetical protein
MTENNLQNKLDGKTAAIPWNSQVSIMFFNEKDLIFLNVIMLSEFGIFEGF